MTTSEDPLEVTEAEKTEQATFCGHAFRQLLRPPPEGPLWYYTSGGTFAEILKSN